MKARRNIVSSDQAVMLDHVRELRLRLLVTVIVLLIGGVVGYLFYEPILQWLKSPLLGDLYYTSPAGSFSFIMKVATMTGIALAVPVIVYQMIMFVRPALAKSFSKLRVVAYTSFSVVLALVGGAFGFFVILPGALQFFAGFQVEGLSALIGADSYLTFVTNVLITFMIVFQIPLLLVIIDHVKPLKPKSLLKAEKYVVLGGLVVSFFVPFALDITTSLLIAAPIVLLYNLSIVLIVVRHRILAGKAVEIQVIERSELVIDDKLIADFFDGSAPDFVETAQSRMPPTLKGLNGFAMEFQKSRRASIDDLRRTIEQERAQAIADKVARYNAVSSMPRTIIDI